MNKKTFVIPALVLGIGALSFLAFQPSVANAAQQAMFGNQEEFISKIAQRTGKSSDEIKTVLTAVREEKHAQRLQALESRVDEAISNGQLSADKKQLIMDHFSKMHQEMQKAVENKVSAEEMKKLHQEHREEMKTWAEENGINLSVLMPNKANQSGQRGSRGDGMHKGPMMF